MSVRRVLVTIVVIDDHYNSFEASIETAEYEPLQAFKERVAIVIDERVQRAGGDLVVITKDP
jgi:hypothetical protein